MRPIHATIMVLLVGCGAILRFSQIGRQSLWLDEYWAQYLASGRGSALFELPSGVVFHPPPEVGFAAAPHWWHIWTGMNTASHPPLYHILLRWWIDVFGDSDVAERSFSAFLSLCAIVIFFILLRYDRGPWPALAGAAVLALAPAQIDLSQQVRAYTLLLLLGLLCCWAVLSIQRRGATRSRALALCIAALAMSLTHYFALGPLMGILLFALIFMRGRNRAAVLGALAVAALLAIAAWGPRVISSFRSQLVAYEDFGRSPDWNALATLRAALTAPARVTVMVNDHLAWSAACGVALLVLSAPLLRKEKSTQTWLWWLWMVCGIGIVALLDFQRHGILLSQTRYLLAAAPGVYALATVPLGRTRSTRWVCPAVILLCVAFVALDRYSLGPPPEADWKQAVQLLQSRAAPRDLIIFAGPFQSDRQPRYAEGNPKFSYIVFRHYAPSARNPVMFVTEPLPPAALGDLAKHVRIWVIGQDPQGQTDTYFPGWHYALMPTPPGARIWRIFP